jgi:hypothetical protein
VTGRPSGPVQARWYELGYHAALSDLLDKLAGALPDAASTEIAQWARDGLGDPPPDPARSKLVPTPGEVAGARLALEESIARPGIGDDRRYPLVVGFIDGWLSQAAMAGSQRDRDEYVRRARALIEASDAIARDRAAAFRAEHGKKS